MLERCLRSLAAQESTDDLDIHILVVDNDATPSAEDVVRRVSSNCPFPIHYHHEPRRGIPMARNRVLEEALALDAEWLAFIDDDQTAWPTWLERHLAVASRDKADAVQPRVIINFPEPAPFWCIPKAQDLEKDAPDGPLESRRRKTVATNGVIMSTRLIRADGMGLRFNERLALSGGEDGEFFETAGRLGAHLVTSRLPVVTEETHPARHSYLRYSLRGFSYGGSFVTRYRLQHGLWAAVKRYSAVSALRALRGVGQLLISPVFVPLAMNRFKFTALEGGRNIFFAAGTIGGLFSLQYEWYRQIDGN
jgi:succinoglycan biosynthesis protein ExoM